MPAFKIKNPLANIRFSIIIPARNEAENISGLLESIQKQTYPKSLFEVIVVDDHSADNTKEVAGNFFKQAAPTLQGKVINSAAAVNSYKKKAIETGIATAKNEWIVCTDADCKVPEKWLECFAAMINETKPVFIAAPVSFLRPAFTLQRAAGQKENQILYVFQVLDFMTLQGITAASVYKKIHNMCNGANLAYKKNVFDEVGGFKGIDNIASGDDMLLMHKIWLQYPDAIQYLKSKAAIVETEAAPSWKAFFNQRIRWASKAKSYDDKRIFTALLLVYFFNFSFLVLLIFSFINAQYFVALLGLWVAKTIVEYPFIVSVSRFFNQRQLVKWFFFFQPLHIIYTIISGFLGSFGKYEWKGRRVK